MLKKEKIHFDDMTSNLLWVVLLIISIILVLIGLTGFFTDENSKWNSKILFLGYFQLAKFINFNSFLNFSFSTIMYYRFLQINFCFKILIFIFEVLLKIIFFFWVEIYFWFFSEKIYFLIFCFFCYTKVNHFLLQVILLEIFKN